MLNLKQKGYIFCQKYVVYITLFSIYFAYFAILQINLVLLFGKESYTVKKIFKFGIADHLQGLLVECLNKFDLFPPFRLMPKFECFFKEEALQDMSPFCSHQRLVTKYGKNIYVYFKKCISI